MPKKNVQSALRNEQTPYVKPNAVAHMYSAEYTLIVFAPHTLSYIKAVEGNINQITTKVILTFMHVKKGKKCNRYRKKYNILNETSHI